MPSSAACVHAPRELGRANARLPDRARGASLERQPGRGFHAAFMSSPSRRHRRSWQRVQRDTLDSGLHHRLAATACAGPRGARRRAGGREAQADLDRIRACAFTPRRSKAPGLGPADWTGGKGQPGRRKPTLCGLRGLCGARKETVAVARLEVPVPSQTFTPPTSSKLSCRTSATPFVRCASSRSSR